MTDPEGGLRLRAPYISAFLTEYSCRIDPRAYRQRMSEWFEATHRFGLPWGTSFDLDFHTIPFHGEDALVEKHYVSKRSRAQKGILAFLAQNAGTASPATRRGACAGTSATTRLKTRGISAWTPTLKPAMIAPHGSSSPLWDPEFKAESAKRVTWEIADIGEGIATLTHELEGAPMTAVGVSGTDETAAGAGGWPWVLSDLKTLLETGRSMSR